MPLTPDPAPPPAPAPEARPVDIPEAPPNSYERQSSALRTDWGALLERRCIAHAVAYGDFDTDGDEDVFVDEISHDTSRIPWELSPNPTAAVMFLNDGSGNFERSDELFGGSVPMTVHPRKAITSDFNGDGRTDIFVAAHGFDRPPFPGEAAVLLLSSDSGLVQAPSMERATGFLHGAASGDIDADGDLDILVADHRNPFALVNEGSGTFSFSLDPLPVSLSPGRHLGMYTVELIYLDDDPFVDLLAAGHEHEGMVTRAFWGDGSGTYSDDRVSEIQSVDGWGIVLDIDAEDLDGDGAKEIILDRTTNEPSYEGFYIQVLTGRGGRQFEDRTERWLERHSSTEIEWLDWLRVVDLDEDGDLDLFADDCGDHGLHWLNDGAGRLGGPHRDD